MCDAVERVLGRVGGACVFAASRVSVRAWFGESQGGRELERFLEFRALSASRSSPCSLTEGCSQRESDPVPQLGAPRSITVSRTRLCSSLLTSLIRGTATRFKKPETSKSVTIAPT